MRFAVVQKLRQMQNARKILNHQCYRLAASHFRNRRIAGRAYLTKIWPDMIVLKLKKSKKDNLNSFHEPDEGRQSFINDACIIWSCTFPNMENCATLCHIKVLSNMENMYPKI